MKIISNQEGTQFKITVPDSDQVNYQIRVFLTLMLLFTLVLLVTEGMIGNLADSSIWLFLIYLILFGFGYLIVTNGMTLFKQKQTIIHIDLEKSSISYSRNNSVIFEKAIFLFSIKVELVTFEIFLECEKPSCLYFRETIPAKGIDLDVISKNNLFEYDRIVLKSSS